MIDRCGTPFDSVYLKFAFPAIFVGCQACWRLSFTKLPNVFQHTERHCDSEKK